MSDCNGTKRPTLCTVPYRRYLYRHRDVMPVPPSSFFIRSNASADTNDLRPEDFADIPSKKVMVSRGSAVVG